MLPQLRLEHIPNISLVIGDPDKDLLLILYTVILCRKIPIPAEAAAHLPAADFFLTPSAEHNQIESNVPIDFSWYLELDLETEFCHNAII